MMRVRVRMCVLAAGGATMLAAAAAFGSQSTYISLGDSLAFGFTTLNEGPFPNDGDRGYVGPYADWLGAQHGGDRPNVFNLAIPAETSSSFFDTTQAYRAANTNYIGSSLSQSQLFASVVASEGALGHSIDTISISIGPDDFLRVADDPNFFNLTPTQQLQILGDTLSQLAVNYQQIVGQARVMAPGASIIVVGDYNPYAILPSSPIYPFAGVLIDNINQIGAAAAAGVGGRFIDTQAAFAGHEAEYTHILDDPFPNENIHPNALGYQVIANLIIPAPSVAAISVAAGLVALRRRR